MRIYLSLVLKTVRGASPFSRTKSNGRSTVSSLRWHTEKSHRPKQWPPARQRGVNPTRHPGEVNPSHSRTGRYNDIPLRFFESFRAMGLKDKISL